MNSEIEKLEKKQGSEFEQAENDLEILIDLIGEEAVVFLKENASIYTETTSEKSIYSKIKFVIIALGRVVEINVNNQDSLDLHFSMMDDYIADSPDKYERTLDASQQGTSLKFMRFIDTLFSLVKKNIPLMILGASGKRSKLMEKIINKYGLSKTFVGHIS
jgi:hypothetical protein